MVSPITRPCSLALPMTLNVRAASGITPRNTLSSQSHTSRVAFGACSVAGYTPSDPYRVAGVGVVRQHGASRRRSRPRRREGSCTRRQGRRGRRRGPPRPTRTEASSTRTMCRDASCRCVVATSATPVDGVREEGISSSLGGSERILRRALHDFSNRRRKHHSVARPPARAIETRGRRARPNERAILSFRHTPRVSSIASIVFERYLRAKPNTRLDKKNVRVVLRVVLARSSSRIRASRVSSSGISSRRASV